MINLKSILDGETGSDPVECETDFPGIASCMADGRDHMPCCTEAGIPEVCTDLCRGEYTVQTDNIKTHFSCAAYTAPTLACIAAGIGNIYYLYKRPKNVEKNRMRRSRYDINLNTKN